MKSLRNIWAKFAATPIGELITGTAYEPHPMDVTVPIGKRFAGKQIVAVFVALDKAATMRVSFDGEGQAKLGAVRNIKKRTTPEFAKIVTEEAKAIGAEWCIVTMQTGWHAVLGQRAARAEPGEAGENASPFYRYKLMLDSPELVVPRAEYTRAHTAIDHPELDKSIVFSVRRAEIESILNEIRGCGLNVASVRIGVAAQLETWLATQKDKGLTQDILVSDGLTSFLLNIDPQSQSFVPPRGSESGDMPRQANARPAALVDDIVRHMDANGKRPVLFIGPEETCRLVKERAPDAEIARPPATPAHAAESAVFLPVVAHDLNIDARDVRPALPRRARRYVIGYAVVLAVAMLTGTINMFHALSSVYAIGQVERENASQEGMDTQARTAIANMSGDFTSATLTKDWISGNVHAQKICYEILHEVPNNVTIDRLTVDAKDGQMTLTFVALGDNDALLKAVRAIETKLVALKYKIGRSDPPLAVGGATRGVQYRMYIIVPDAGEAS